MSVEFNYFVYEAYIKTLGFTESSKLTYKRLLKACNKYDDPIDALRDPEISSSSKQGRYAALKRYAEAVEDHSLMELLMTGEVKRLLNSRGTKMPKQSTPFKKDDLDRFVEELDKLKNNEPFWAWPTITIMWKLGLRAGIDLTGIQQLHLHDALRTGRLVIWTKGEHTREVPASPVEEPLMMLMKYKEKWTTLDRLIAPKSEPGNSEAAYRAVVALIKKIAKRAGLNPDDFNAHRFRHTCAMRLYEDSGHDIQMVQKLLGHSSITTTQMYLKADRIDEMAEYLK